MLDASELAATSVRSAAATAVAAAAAAAAAAAEVAAAAAAAGARAAEGPAAAAVVAYMAILPAVCMVLQPDGQRRRLHTQRLQRRGQPARLAGQQAGSSRRHRVANPTTFEAFGAEAEAVAAVAAVAPVSVPSTLNSAACARHTRRRRPCRWQRNCVGERRESLASLAPACRAYRLGSRRRLPPPRPRDQTAELALLRTRRAVLVGPGPG